MDVLSIGSLSTSNLTLCSDNISPHRDLGLMLSLSSDLLTNNVMITNEFCKSACVSNHVNGRATLNSDGYYTGGTRGLVKGCNAMEPLDHQIKGQGNHIPVADELRLALGELSVPDTPRTLTSTVTIL